MQNRSFWGSIPPVTLNLIIINFIVWLAALTLPKIAGIDLNYLLGLHYIEADDFTVVEAWEDDVRIVELLGSVGVPAVHQV